jgi:hypothetical protein
MMDQTVLKKIFRSKKIEFIPGVITYFVKMILLTKKKEKNSNDGSQNSFKSIQRHKIH